MLRILHNTSYDFIRFWRIAVGATVAFLLIALATFAINPRFNQSIEFTGGTMLQVEFANAPHVDELRSTLTGAGIREPVISTFGSSGREFTIKAGEREQVAAQEAGAATVAEEIRSALTTKFGAGSYTVKDTHAIGPRVGDELRRGAFLAVLISFAITMGYLAWRFEWRFGVAAVLATAHDIIATIAFIKLMHIEISLTVIAGILTVLGYSLNDTIIIFDRVREDLRKKRKESLYVTLNRAINETLPRSILTHATTLAATLALLFFAGEVIRPFAWVMTFGIFTGTLSSIYIAGPTLLWIERKWPREVGDRSGVGARSRETMPAAATPVTAAKPARPAAVTTAAKTPKPARPGR
jgi:preprotein translocase subunit SecF